jgi:hypothetical protein
MRLITRAQCEERNAKGLYISKTEVVWLIWHKSAIPPELNLAV